MDRRRIGYSVLVSPWYVATFKYEAFDRKQGRLSERLVSDVAGNLQEYTPVSV